jgi:hypothetical protein
MRRAMTLLVLAVSFVLAQSQSKTTAVNPATQISWWHVGINGAPTTPACTSTNYGQPYFDLTNHVLYICAWSGWASFSGSGGGLTSFTSGSLSPLFTTSLGSTPTTAPALAFALSNAAQNTFLAGPASGGTGSAPTYRMLVNSDFVSTLSPVFSAANLTNFPTLNQSTTGLAANITAASNSTLATLSALLLPYSQLSGTPTIPTSANWPNAGTCASGLYVTTLTNSIAPLCATVQYAQLGGTVPIWNQNTIGTAGSLGTTGGNGMFWGVSGGVQGWHTPVGSGTVNSGTAYSLAYYPASGGAQVSGVTPFTGLAYFSVSAIPAAATAAQIVAAIGSTAVANATNAVSATTVPAGGLTGTALPATVINAPGLTAAAGGAFGAGAYAAVPTLSGLGGVPTTTTVNGHALSTNVVVAASDLTTGILPHAQLPTLLSGDIPSNAANTSGTAAKATALSSTGGNGTYWGVSGSTQGWNTPVGTGTVNSGTAYSLAYYPSGGGTQVGGVTPFTGFAYYSVSAAPAQATAAQLVAAIGSTAVANAINASVAPASGLTGTALPVAITTASGLTTAAGGVFGTGAYATIANYPLTSSLGTGAYCTAGTTGSDCLTLSGGLVPAANLPTGTSSVQGALKLGATGGADVYGAAAAITLAGLGGVPTTTTINSHALSANVVLSASDLTTGTLPHAQLPALLSGDIPNNGANTTGQAAVATVLAGTPTLCAPGTAPTGILPSGNATGCAALPTGTLTAVSVATANGFQGTSSGTATPVLTLRTDSTHVLPVNTGAATSYLNQAGSYSVPVGTYSLPTQYTKGACTEVWGGTNTSSALQSGDDAIANNTCYNDSGVTRTITAVKCRADVASNTTSVNPTFGSAGTGTTILSGALTCGSSYAYSSTGAVSNASWTTGSGIDPTMGGTLTGTSIAMIVEYTF